MADNDYSLLAAFHNVDRSLDVLSGKGSINFTIDKSGKPAVTFKNVSALKQYQKAWGSIVKLRVDNQTSESKPPKFKPMFMSKSRHNLRKWCSSIIVTVPIVGTGTKNSKNNPFFKITFKGNTKSVLILNTWSDVIEYNKLLLSLVENLKE